MERRRPRVVAVFTFAVVLPLAFSAAAEPPIASRPAATTRPSMSAGSPPSAAQDAAAVELVRTRAAIENQRLRLAGALQPNARAKLQEPIRQTLQAASKKTVPAPELLDIAKRSVGNAFGGLSKAGVEAMALVALMEAEKDTRNEVNETRTRLDAVRQAKDCRSALACLEALAGKGGVSKEMADKAIEDIKKQRDSLSEMGEMESLRLQMAMDRMSKLMSTLSSVLKKISETSETITQNIK